MNWITPLFGLIGFEAVANVFAKEYSLKGGWILWCASIGGFIICNIFWLIALKNGSGMARGGLIFALSSAIISVVLGLYFYNESLSGMQTAGVIGGIVSLALIFWK